MRQRPQTRPDRQRSELIDCFTAGLPIRELLFIEALGDMRLPLSEYRLDHRTRIDLAAIDAHGAAEAATNIGGPHEIVFIAKRGGIG